MIKTLLTTIEQNNDIAAVIPIERLDDLIMEMEELENSDSATGFVKWAAGRRKSFKPTGLAFEARSVIVVASPSPLCIININYNGIKHEVVLPPTYCDYYQTKTNIASYINDALIASGYQAELTYNLPNKLLAVHCGLGEYGRSNICYIHGFGSYANLLAFYSDIPCEDHKWHPAKQMDECSYCNKCVKACPTKAIDESKNIIDATICLTSINEGHKDFPDWLDNSMHKCIVGCMECQDCCPKNEINSNFTILGCEFDESETQYILEHKADEYPEGIVEKLKSVGIFDFGDRISRNLKAFLSR